MDEELDKLTASGVTKEELDRAKTKIKSRFVSQRETVMGKAEEIHHYIRFHKDLSEINTDLDNFMAVTPADIQRVAKTYLGTANRTLVVAAPPKSS
jgi:predicted Zn-dependent peptidase